MNCKIILLIALISSTVPELQAGEKEMRKLLASCSEEDRTRLIGLYKTAEKEGLSAEIIQQRIAEGFSKNISPRDLLKTGEQKLEELRWIKNFCKNTESSALKIRPEKQNVNKLSRALKSGLQPKEIEEIHRLTARQTEKTDIFLETVKTFSQAAKKNIPFSVTQEILQAGFEMNQENASIRRMIGMLPAEDPQKMEQLKQLIISGIREKRNFFELEDAVRRKEYSESRGSAEEHSVQDSEREERRKIRGQADGGKEAEGKRRGR